MDDAANGGFDRRSYQDAGVLNRNVMSNRASCEANPIGNYPLIARNQPIGL